MTFPTPTGAAPIIQDFTKPNPSLTYDQAIAQLIAQMKAQGDTTLAKDFNSFQKTYHKAHPSVGALSVLQAYLDTTLGKGLGKAVGQTVTVLGKIPDAAAKGAAKAAGDLGVSPIAGPESAAPAGTGNAIIYMLFEVVAVGIMAVIAGINRESGKAMVALMAAFWLIAIIVGSAGVAGIGNFIAGLTGNAPYSPKAFQNYAPTSVYNPTAFQNYAPTSVYNPTAFQNYAPTPVYNPTAFQNYSK